MVPARRRCRCGSVAVSPRQPHTRRAPASPRLRARRRLYERAGEAGNAKAMHNLAVMYAQGPGDTPAGLQDGCPVVRPRAAEHGVADSQYNLGILYARGSASSRASRRATSGSPSPPPGATRTPARSATRSPPGWTRRRWWQPASRSRPSLRRPSPSCGQGCGPGRMGRSAGGSCRPAGPPGPSPRPVQPRSGSGLAVSRRRAAMRRERIDIHAAPHNIEPLGM